MRTIFTNENLQDFIVKAFKDNTIDVILKDEVTGESMESDMASYLNVDFYTWWQHAESALQEIIDNGGDIRTAWRNSLNFSLNKAYALIEQTDEEAINSQDIDGATLRGRISFMIQANKIKNLEYYMKYLKEKYLGNPQSVVTANGETITCFFTLGILLYDEQPEIAQNGEVIMASINFRFAYMSEALTYSDVKMSLSLDGTNYYAIPISKYDFSNMITTEAVPRADRVDLTGRLATSIGLAITLTFFDFNEALNTALNTLFWTMSAYKINETTTTTQAVNKEVFLKVETGGNTYYYDCVITNFTKNFQNNDFIISTLGLSGWGKVGA